MSKPTMQSLLSACLFSAAGSLMFGCYSNQAEPEQEQDIQPLGSVAACDSAVADLCLGATDPQACLQGLGGICPDVVAVDPTSCEAKFAAACESYGVDPAKCATSAVDVCGAFSAPGACFDDAYTACVSLGGADALCTDVANALCSSQAVVSCSDFVDKMCSAIPLSQDQCTAAHQHLCAAGGSPGSVTPGSGTGGGTGSGTLTPGGSGSPTVGPAAGQSCKDYVQSICDANQVPQDQCDARIAAYCT